MDRRPRILSALLIAALFSSFCGMGTLCAAAQPTTAVKCCCPVEGSSPCLDAPAEKSAPAPERDGVVESSKLASLEAPSAERLEYFATGADRFPSMPFEASRTDNPPPVHLLCCVFLR